MNSKFYQILMIVIFTYICSVAIYTTWGLFQIQMNRKTPEWFYYSTNNKTYKLKIADNEAAYAKGLSGLREKPTDYDGMIFIFKEKHIMSFWNQGLYLDLDIFWLEDFKLIGQDSLNAFYKKGIQIIAPSRPVNHVIELFK